MKDREIKRGVSVAEWLQVGMEAPSKGSVAGVNVEGLAALRLTTKLINVTRINGQGWWALTWTSPSAFPLRLNIMDLLVRVKASLFHLVQGFNCNLQESCKD